MKRLLLLVVSLTLVLFLAAGCSKSTAGGTAASALGDCEGGSGQSHRDGS